MCVLEQEKALNEENGMNDQWQEFEKAEEKGLLRGSFAPTRRVISISLSLIYQVVTSEFF